MKQYGTAPINYTSCGMDAYPPFTKRKEAIYGGSYDKLIRGRRRLGNKNAETWWRRQVESERTAGMPWLYHCGGVK